MTVCRCQDRMSIPNLKCLDSVVTVYWGDAEAVERDDRGAPPRGARRDPGHYLGAGGRARAEVGDDVADRREDRHRTGDAIQVLPGRRSDPGRLAPTSRHRPPRISRRTRGPSWRRP